MAKLQRSRFGDLGQLFRFYQAAVANATFGFGTYALLIWLGVNIYVAQIVSQILGVTFNYTTYSRHVFRGRLGAKWRFIAAYGVNYLVSLCFLALFDQLIASKYLAGFAAAICAALVNYFALRHMVFVREATK